MKALKPKGLVRQTYLQQISNELLNSENIISFCRFVKWSFDEIKEAHKRRYLLQDCAIEVFSNDGSNHLLVFPKESARNKVYGRYDPPCNKYIDES